MTCSNNSVTQVAADSGRADGRQARARRAPGPRGQGPPPEPALRPLDQCRLTGVIIVSMFEKELLSACGDVGTAEY